MRSFDCEVLLTVQFSDQHGHHIALAINESTFVLLHVTEPEDSQVTILYPYKRC